VDGDGVGMGTGTGERWSCQRKREEREWALVFGMEIFIDAREAVKEKKRIGRDEQVDRVRVRRKFGDCRGDLRPKAKHSGQKGVQTGL
jgi:hypothetical protein